MEQGGAIECSQDIQELADELSRLRRLMERVHARHVDGVERAAYLLLVPLVADGPRRLSALAEAVHSDVSTVSRQVAYLVELGLVERRPDPQDGRACVLAATSEGERLFRLTRRRRAELFAELLGSWPEADRRRLRELLGRFNDDYERFFFSSEAGPAGWEPWASRREANAK